MPGVCVCSLMYRVVLVMYQSFDEKLLVGDSGSKKPMNDKRKKEMFKQLVQDVIGVSQSFSCLTPTVK